ncbi:MAG: hypothetical protein RMH97_01185 [Verrucomicrobiales bacterium]|nr:hypothetical protein [Verrucomicrobiales bacterium]
MPILRFDTVALVRLPTSSRTVYTPLVVPYQTAYPTTRESGLGSHISVTVEEAKVARADAMSSIHPATRTRTLKF